jgi:trimeric autotransporter adhesin
MKKLTNLIYVALPALALVCFALSPVAQAVVPPPDGGYPNFTTAEGTKALQNLTTGAGNTGVGWYSLFSAGAANNNTGVGAGALALNTADNNTAVGLAALFLNTTGALNTAVGTGALVFNDSGSSNSAFGAFALYNNTAGGANTAIGTNALTANNTGTENTAIGFSALEANTTFRNTAVGSFALHADTTGDSNTAVGQAALLNDTTGFRNTGVGWQALALNTTGGTNTALGDNALQGNTTGHSNIAVGTNAGLNQTTGSENVYIGEGVLGVAGESNHTYIRNIKDTIVSGGGTDFVSVNLTTGLLGHVSSSRRYKEQIEPMDKASEALYRLKPVTYRFKKGIDPTQGLEYGLVAEDVAQVNPNLAIRNGKGQIESVRYMAINAMLLNEFLKEHRKNEEQGAMIARQQKQIDALTAGLQKVSAQFKLNKSAPQTAANAAR